MQAAKQPFLQIRIEMCSRRAMHVSKLVLAVAPNSLNSVCVHRWVVGVHKVDGVVQPPDDSAAGCMLPTCPSLCVYLEAHPDE